MTSKSENNVLFGCFDMSQPMEFYVFLEFFDMTDS